MSAADLFDSAWQPKTHGRGNGRGGEDGDDWMPCGHGKVAEYRYLDEDGILLFAVARCDRKGNGCQGFRQWRPDPAKRGGKAWNLDGVRRVLYRLPEVERAVAAGRDVWLVEGEKDVGALETAGVVATCNPMGAGSWLPAYTEQLKGASVVVVADRDQAGRRHAADVAGRLHGVAHGVVVVEARAGKDATDHLAAGHGLDDFVPAELPPPATPEDVGDDDLADRMDAAAAFARAVERSAYDLRVRDAARRKIRREGEDANPPEFVRLDTFLAETDDDPTYRLDRIWPTGGRVLLAAQWKAGKSTVVGNLVRALADGEPFLDRFTVTRPARVALIDDELDQRTLRRWMRDHDVAHADRVHLLGLRGHAAAFDVLDPDVSRAWATKLAEHGVDVVVLDCLRPVLDALGLDESHDAGRFLVAFDALLAAAEVGEALVVHHMGHGAERSRGDSRLLDWPDAAWKLVRDKDDDDPEGAADDPAGVRYFSAYGRDVDHPQAELGYDPATRRLTLSENASNRKESTERRKSARLDQAIVATVERIPGIGKNRLRIAAKARTEDVADAVERLLEDGSIQRRIDQSGHHHHYPADVTAGVTARAGRLPEATENPDKPTTVSRVSRCFPEPPETPGEVGVSRTRRDGTTPPPTHPRGADETPETGNGHATHPPTPPTCPHGMANGDRPDPFVNGRLSCPRCASEEKSR